MQEMQETRIWSLGREDSLEESRDNPLHYSCLENPVDRDTWWATAHEVAKESDITEHAHMHVYIYREILIDCE